MAKDKQKLVAKNIVANRGNLKQGMIDAGYSESYARNSQQFKWSKSWEELMDEYLPNEMVTSKHHELINAKKIATLDFPANIKDSEIISILKTVNGLVISINRTRTTTSVWYSVTDNLALRTALDMAYRLKGRYVATLQDPPIDEGELEEQLREVRAKIKAHEAKMRENGEDPNG